MNTEAQRARNARKRAKSRIKARCGTGGITRFQVRVELIHKCCFDEGDRCSWSPTGGKITHKIAATLGGWVSPYDGAPIYKCKFAKPSSGFTFVTGIGEGVLYATPKVTCVSDWIIYGTHDVSDKAREYLEVFNAMVKGRTADHPEGYMHDFQALTTLTVQQDGGERSTTWRGEVEAVAADVIAVLLR